MSGAERARLLIEEARQFLAGGALSLYLPSSLLTQLLAALELELDKNELMRETEITYLAELRRLAQAAHDLADDGREVQGAIRALLDELPEGQ